MRRHLCLALSIALVASCGGGDGGDPPASSGSIASAPNPMDPSCTGGAAAGTLYTNAEVEPYAAVNPTRTNHLIGAWLRVMMA